MILNETYTLQNGVKIPKLGLGTWFIPNEQAAKAVCDAVSIGYLLIDTAQAYGNEHGVGEGIRTCGIPRKDVFVTTKLAAEIKSYDEAVAAIEKSLELMGLDYIDMMIIHAPQPWSEFRGVKKYTEGNLEAWRALEVAYKAGKLRAIGVINFEVEDLENLINGSTVRPMVNQILCHIGNTPSGLISWCQNNNIVVEAYSPMGHGEMFKNEQVKAIAEKYEVGVSQLCIRYCLQLGTVALPKTANPEHMRENADVDFEISAEDMDVLKKIAISDYGDASIFPVYGGRKDASGNYRPGKPHTTK